ncbi:MAG: hypothetical protein ABEJ28_02795 [Salinigranum sp.]
MEVRDAVEDDAESLAELADAPTDVMRNLVHDRTVRVAEDPDPNGDAETNLGGFVSFDAREGTVYVTQLAGTTAACDRLLDEPIRFADAENMAVELLVEEDRTEVRTAVEREDFEDCGPGPTFDGRPTVRYRLETNGTQ